MLLEKNQSSEKYVCFERIIGPPADDLWSIQQVSRNTPAHWGSRYCQNNFQYPNKLYYPT